MRTWVQRIRAISPWIAPAIGVALAAGVGAAQADKAAEVLAQVRTAMGGEKAAALKSLSAEGTARISFGEREMSQDIQFKIVLPDHFQRITTPEMPNGMPGPRLAFTLNGAEAWAGSLDPMPNFGGGPGGGGGERGGGAGGGGGMFMINAGGPGGPAQTGRIRGELLRFVLGIVSSPDAVSGVTYSYVGTAQSKDGEADVLAVKADGLDGKLFIDKKTHLPLMLTYMARDMMRIVRRDAPTSAPAADPNETPEAREKRLAEERQKRVEEMRKQIENAPPVENQFFYADYKDVNGVMLPHRFTRAVNGNASEETEITKYKINPKIDLNDFRKKGS